MDPLVLIPGFMADGRVFLDQLSDLSKDRTVMAAKPTGDSISEMADSILAIAPPQFAVAGHGLGAAVATEVLRRASERVTRIALICASAQAETPSEAANREPRLVKAQMGRLGDALHEELPADALGETPFKRAIRNHWIEMALEKGLEEYQRQCRIMQRRPDVQNVLRRARIPALVLAGKADILCPRRGQDFIAQLMPYAEFVEIEKAGHLPMLEAPQTTSEVMQKWLEVDPPFVLR